LLTASAPVDPVVRAVNLTAQIRDLLRHEAQKPLAHDRAEPILENPLEILNSRLCRGQYAFISLHSVGWFKRLFKQTVSEHRPINQHYFTLTQ
jgi:hypothetical protein